MTTPLRDDWGPNEVITSTAFNDHATEINAVPELIETGDSAAVAAVLEDAAATFMPKPIRAYKTAAQTHWSTTVINDLQLGAALEATRYRFKLRMPIEGPSDGRFKVQWSVPTGATMIWGQVVAPNNSTTPGATSQPNLSVLDETSNSVCGVRGVGTKDWVEYQGQITLTEAGPVRVQWSQSVLSATAGVTVHAGAWLELEAIGTSTKPLSGGQWVFNDQVFTVNSPERDWNLLLATNYARFELREGDQRQAEIDKGRGLERVELSGPRFLLNTDVWVAYRFRFTGTLDGREDRMITLNQFHQRPEAALGEVSKVPSLAFMLVNGGFQIQTSGDAAPVTTEQRMNLNVRYFSLWTQTGSWVEIVCRAKFHHSAGELQVWKDGAEILNLTGILMGYNDTAVGARPTCKFGMYRASTPETQVIETVNFEVGTASLFSRVASPLPLPTIP